LEEKYQALNPKFQVPLVLEFLEKKKNRIKKTKGKRKKNIWTTTSLLNKYESAFVKKNTQKVTKKRILSSLFLSSLLSKFSQFDLKIPP